MNKINPKIVKGEPECSEECPYFKRIGFGNKDTLSKSYYWCDEMKDKTMMNFLAFLVCASKGMVRKMNLSS